MAIQPRRMGRECGQINKQPMHAQGMHFFYHPMKKILILLLLCGFISTGSAQGPLPPPEKPHIEVTGTAETEIEPDEIYVVITLQERSENREKLTIEKQEQQLKQSLKDLGIDLSLLSLNRADADYRRYKVMKTDVIVSKSYTLKLSSAEQLSKVYQQLDKINVLDAYISHVSHSKKQQFEKETRIKAAKAAKEKAEYLLEAIGQKAGNVLYMTEQASGYYNPMPRAMAVNSLEYAVPQMDKMSELSFQKIKITASVVIKYEILNK